MSYQPRWLAYAAFMGQPPGSAKLKTPDFMAWIVQKKREYQRARGDKQGEPIFDHDAFTAFLINHKTE